MGLCIASISAAGSFTYTFEGIGSGDVTLTGNPTPVPFTNAPFLFRFTADSADTKNYCCDPWGGGGIATAKEFTHGEVNIAGYSGQFNGWMSASLGYDSPHHHFDLILEESDSDSMQSVIQGYDNLGDYDLMSSFGPLLLTKAKSGWGSGLYDFPEVPTSFGSFKLSDNLAGFTFSAVAAVPEPGSVPEPGTFLIGGIGLLAVFALRRHKK
jgi:hypothetical protein